MRKRSGAFHSESEEQFLLLAELSHEKTGYFYDETIHSQLSKQLKQRYKQKSPKEQNKNPFLGFQFSSLDIEKQEEQRELQIKTKHKQIIIVVVCSKPSHIKQILLQLYPTNTHNQVYSPISRQIDLFVLNIKDRFEHLRCFKFWIISSGHSSNPIYSTYLKKASRIINFSLNGSVEGEQRPFKEARTALEEVFSSFEY